MAQTFARKERLLHSSEFQNVFQEPQRVATPTLTILFKKNSLGYSRLGLVVAKKQFKKAVTRNFLKRCLREWFRKQKEFFPSIDIVALPKKGLELLETKDFNQFMGVQWQRLLKKSLSL